MMLFDETPSASGVLRGKDIDDCAKISEVTSNKIQNSIDLQQDMVD